MNDIDENTVLKAVENNNGIDEIGVAKELGVKPFEVKRYLKMLVVSGDIYSDGELYFPKSKTLLHGNNS